MLLCVAVSLVDEWCVHRQCLTMNAPRSFETSRTTSPQHGVTCRKTCAVSTAACLTMNAPRSFATSRTTSPQHGVTCRKTCAVSTAAVGTVSLSLGQQKLSAAQLLQLMFVISRLQFPVDNARVKDSSLPLLSSVAVTALAAELACSGD